MPPITSQPSLAGAGLFITTPMPDLPAGENPISINFALNMANANVIPAPNNFLGVQAFNCWAYSITPSNPSGGQTLNISAIRRIRWSLSLPQNPDGNAQANATAAFLINLTSNEVFVFPFAPVDHTSVNEFGSYATSGDIHVCFPPNTNFLLAVPYQAGNNPPQVNLTFLNYKD